jgi:CRP/FNR family transcriptional regulator/CRP/FNR family cyclic AMP-dependent transcriptional regulator
VVLDGRVKLTLHSSAGTELQLAVVEPGELFGELSALDGQPRPFNATALDDSEVLALRPETVLTAVKSTPWLALWLVRALGEQLRAGYEFIGDTVFLDVAGRLAKKLLDLSEADDAEESETPVGIPFTQRDLAGMLGVTRETVNKNLAAFRARGAIEVRRRRIVVRHREALRRRIY